MIIQCPQCKTQARLPESQEGAKVRCSECERVYSAIPVGAARGSSAKNTALPIYIAVGVGVAIMLVAVMMMSGKREEIQPIAAEPTVEKELPVAVDYEGWNSAPVKLVREFHRAALSYNEAKLRQMIDGKRTWERVQAEAVEAAEKQAERGLAENEAPIEPDSRSWSELAQDQRATFVGEIVEQVCKGSEKELIADWTPYDGKVLAEVDGILTVEVSLKNDVDLTGRTFHWKVVRDGENWRAFSWKRFYSQSEMAELARNRAKKTKKVTLSDGSLVFEGEPGPIAHFEDTPTELRSEIDIQYATMIDQTIAPRKNAAALRALIEVGKPALPVLLTGLFNIPLDTDEHAMQLNLIDQALRGITGHYTTFDPMSGDEKTEERRQSGIKQWFGWYNRKGKRFTEKKFEEDGIDTALQPRSAGEQRAYEKALKDLAKEQN